jgi:formylglycine-generating enzyme required for sulfatase activity
MKKVAISLFALLLLAAQAQAQRQPLAVLVVGVDNWMFGDVLAHIAGEELKRGNPNLVPVTREKCVQNKLKALRRASGDVDICDVYKWAQQQGLSEVCLVEAKAGSGYSTFSFSHDRQAYSAQVIDVADKTWSCVAAFDFTRSGGGEMAPTELTKVAWEVAGRLQSSGCKTSKRITCLDWEPNMVFVGKGSFRMGCDDVQYEHCSDLEKPVHDVELTNDFWIGETEITQGEWKAVMGSYPSKFSELSDAFKGDDLPVVCVSYNDIMGMRGYLEKLNEKAGITVDSLKYRLPTEAEWEYAARGGHHQENLKYSGSNDISMVAWFYGTGGGGIRVGKELDPNALGAYDMSGNVGEWCEDSWDTKANYPQEKQTNPKVKTGSYRIIRGGSWADNEKSCHVATRSCVSPNTNTIGNLPIIGFRVVLPK